MLRLFLAFLLMCSFVPGAQAAESVSVRSSRRGDFSRLVFDWGKKSSYKANVSSGKLILSFDKGGSAAAPESVENLLGFHVDSQEPLKVTIDIPEGSKIRDFAAGSRVIVDIYDPPGSAVKGKKSEQKSAAKPAPEKLAEKPVPAKTEEKKPEPQKETEQKTAEAEKPAEKLTEPPPEPGPEAVEAVQAEKIAPLKKAQEKKSKVGSNLIMFSSTNASKMAVFKRGGEVWMVNDDVGLLLEPQISGPQAEAIKPLREVSVQRAKVYVANIVPDALVKGEGGGLLWRVIQSGQPGKEQAVRPVVEGATDMAPRGGKIIWPFQEVGDVLDVPDPMTGKMLKVVTVGNAKQFAGPEKEFVDFVLVESPLGIAILPKVDDLEVSVTSRGVEVSRPDGLALSTERAMALASEAAREEPAQMMEAAKDERRVFDFKNWQMGGISALAQNQSIVLGSIPGLPESERVESLVNLAKMYLSNGLWAEAQGFLDFAAEELPDLDQTAEFQALKGVSEALGYKSEVAFEMLSGENLKKFEEIAYWKSFVLADLGDWQQAFEILPDNFKILADYPPVLKDRLALGLTEVALRGGDLKRGQQLLGMIEGHSDNMAVPQKAAFDYLKGEAARQSGDIEGTKKLWEPLMKGPDDLFRAKAGLALTRLLVDKKMIKPPQAIDNLERLRYSWRGDELEAQINYWLGKTYFEAGEYVKGLNNMRDAAALAAGTDLGQRITAEMTDAFTNLFLGPDLQKVTPLDAAALYEQFSELLPPGENGDQVVQKLAEHMVKSDLLDRAAGLLQGLFDNRLQGLEAFKVGVRLSAIKLLDNKPLDAIKVIDKSEAILKGLPEEAQTPKRKLEISLLRARGLSKSGRPDQALKLLHDLDPYPEVNRLQADIAWNAAYWDDAAEALGDVIVDENVSLTRPLSDEHKNLILKRVIAQNLSNDRVGLANMREKYSDPMAQTDKAQIFEVITRPRQSAALADRETLMSVVSEVELFDKFLQTYKDEPKDEKAKEPVATN